MSNSIDMINDAESIPERWVWNFAPFLRMRYRLDKQGSVSLHYVGRSSQPSMNQLQPVADYTNPLNVVQGNPELKPPSATTYAYASRNSRPKARGR